MNLPSSPYPASSRDRDRWVTARRGQRERVDPDHPYAYLVEQERFASGECGPVATIFLTNRECPWRCAMCDLWRHTLSHPVPVGAIPRQIEYALSRLPAARQIKLYNSGSFFDPGAIPAQDYQAIAGLVRGFERVIVECHPALLGDRCLQFQQMLDSELEVAMGLETANAQALDKLNKRMTVEQFAAAAEWLLSNRIALRSFLLVMPPFLAPQNAPHWLRISIDMALQCGSTVTTLIPTRDGNGAVDALALQGAFMHPPLRCLEEALSYGLARADSTSLRSGHSPQRVFADLWNVERFATCDACRADRVTRLRTMNESQATLDAISCSQCGGLS